MAEHQTLGRLGEEAAVMYLKKKKYAIVCCNFRTRYGEIDIVATHANTLVFIEVKTRKDNAFGTPAEAVTPMKQRKIRTMAESYLQQHPVKLPVRFDVVTVIGSVVQGKINIEEIALIQNAF